MAIHQRFPNGTKAMPILGKTICKINSTSSIGLTQEVRRVVV